MSPPYKYWLKVRWLSVRWLDVRWPSVRWLNVRWLNVPDSIATPSVYRANLKPKTSTGTLSPKCSMILFTILDLKKLLVFIVTIDISTLYGYCRFIYCFIKYIGYFENI